MERLSVVHAVPDLGIGGTQKALQLLVTNLDDDRFDISVVVTEADGVRGEKLRECGYEVVVTDGDRDALAAHLAKRDADILHLHGAGAGNDVVAAAQQADVPITVKTDNFGWTDEPSVRVHVDRYYFVSRTILLRYLRLHHLSLSGDWRRDYGVLYNPVATSSVDEDAGVTFRDRYDVPRNVPLLGKIGRPTAAKWGQITVDAFERVHQRRPDAMLALVTPPEKTKRELAALGLSDNVVCVDQIPLGGVDAFYRAIDVLTHASAMGETFGYVLAEALVNETPVVVNSNPMRDNAQIEVVDNGETGYVASSTAGYAEATLDLLAKDATRRRFGEQGRERMHTRYGAEVVAAKLEQEYLALAHEYGLEGGRDVERSVVDMAAFQREYRRRLNDTYGPTDRTTGLERWLWDVTTEFLPAKREVVYKACRLGVTKLTEEYGL